jgi:alkylation response protein AidB-like acyl-CoA dehydrogenase
MILAAGHFRSPPYSPTIKQGHHAPQSGAKPHDMPRAMESAPAAEEMPMAARTSAARAEPGPGDDYLERVARVAPTITDAADRIESERRIAPGVLAALHKEALFRMLLPRPFGGGEVDPACFFQAISAIAERDASTAWCVCQANGCAMTAAYLEPEVADEIWGKDPQAVLAWAPGKAEAVPEDGGFRLTGNWSFVSGGRHATWLGGHCTVPGEDGSSTPRTMLFPAGEAEMSDIWHVLGLRGTASDAYAVDGLFIRHGHSVARDDPAERRYEAPLYQFPAMALYAIGFSGVALGIARSMLTAFRELAGEKTPRRAKGLLRDNGMVQAEVALCEARLGSARAYLLDEVRDIWAAVVATGELTVAQRMRIRLASTYLIHEAKEVADAAYDAAGATAIFTSSAFERRFRDIHTVTQQLQGRKAHFQSVGAFLLGNEPDMSVI